MRKFEQILQNLRNDRGLTMEELAKMVGVSKSAINNYEKGTRYPKREVLEAISDVFNVDMDYLTGRSSMTTRILSDEELRLINAYRSASGDTKNAVAAILGVKRAMPGESKDTEAV